MASFRVCFARLALVVPALALVACERDDPRPALPTGPDASLVAAGMWATVEASHSTSTCGLSTTNQAFCWGSNNRGELGDGTVSFQSSPMPVAGGHRFMQVSAGGELACGLTTTGQAYCWGTDVFGQVGHGRDTGDFCSPGPDESCDNGRFQHPVPRAVAGGLTFTEVAAGYGHACGLTAAGEIWCWGGNDAGQLGTDAKAGQTGLCQTGVGAPWFACSNAPVKVESNGVRFGRVIASRGFTCALTPAGKAYCWGSNGSGWLGNGTTTSTDRPSPVSGNLTFASLSSSFTHVCGMTTTGVAYCWGQNYNGQVGDGTSLNIRTTPTKVVGLPAVRSITAGGATSCAVTTAGVAWCWGEGNMGQLGNGTQVMSPRPVRVSGGLTWQSIDAGYYHNCGLTTSGAAYCWGVGGGQLGYGYNGAPETCAGFTPCSLVPRAVVPPTTFNAPPAPRLTFSCSGLTCTFDAAPSTDDGTIRSYQWVFGDGKSASGARVTHTYAVANYYGMGLTVTDDGGQSRSDGEVVQPTTIVDALPVARFTFNCTGLTCSFNASGSTDDRGIVHYRWHFGDDTPFTSGVTTNHAFRAAGTYRVTLTVTDTRNQVGSSAQFVTAGGGSPNSPPAPVIQRPFDGATYSAGMPVPFLGSATDPEDGTLVGTTFVWSSSRDGQLASGVDTFSSSTLSVGKHVITLAAADSKGLVGTASVSITITATSNQPPVASFTWACNATGCRLTSTSSDPDGDSLTCSWHSDGAGHKDKAGCTITRLRLPGNAPWNETLTVTDGKGGTASVTKLVQP